MSSRVSQGYTVLETMIFLAVTSALFVLIFITFQGRQASTEFLAATREMESRIKDIINDVDTGYYAGTETVTCKIGNNWKLDIQSKADGERGTNGDCIFLGKAIQFGVKDKPTEYNVLSIAGARKVRDTNKLVETYNDTEAEPIPSATQTFRLPAGLTFVGMRTTKGLRSTVAFLSPLNQYLGKRNTSALNLSQIAALPVSPVGPNDSLSTPAAARTNDLDTSEKLIRALGSDFAYHTALAFDATTIAYVDVCMDGSRVNRNVIYRIGNAQRLGEVEVIIGEGPCLDEFRS